MGVQVFSLFDGMACGMLAMQGTGLKVDRYVAYEIDKFAIKTSTHNFPMIEHRGDVFNADFTEFENFDFLIGGSPCTYWSIAQKNNRETEASGMGWELFSQYVRALNEAKPDFFIYENNKSMSTAIRQSITDTFGFEPVLINSALVSAQNRQRLYWVGMRNEDGIYIKVDVKQPKDLGILLKDVLESGIAWEKKQDTIDANYHKGGNYSSPKKQSGQRLCVAEPAGMGYRGRMNNGKWVKQYESNGTEKGNALTTAQTDSMVAEPVYVGAIPDNNGTYLNGKQPSQQYRVYDPNGKGVAITTCAITNVPEKVGCYPSPDGTIKNCQGMRIYSVEGKSVTQGAQSGGIGANTGLYARPIESQTVANAIPKLVDKYGYLPEMFNAYNKAEINDKAPTLSTGSMVTSSCAVNMVAEMDCYAIPVEWDENGNPVKAVSSADGKVYTVYEVKGGQITIKGKRYPIKLPDDFYIIRKLTVRECMRLQTVPEYYEFPVSDTQAYKMLGNGWTVEVIIHLIKSIINDFTNFMIYNM